MTSDQLATKKLMRPLVSNTAKRTSSSESSCCSRVSGHAAGILCDAVDCDRFAHGGWANAYFGEEVARRSLERLRTCDYFLCGRRTYEMFSRAWPNADGPYADKLNSIPKLVSSTTLTAPLTWNATHQERGHHPVSLLCSVLSVSRQAYYAWTTCTPSRRELRDRELEGLVWEVYRESRETYGAPRIAKTLRRKRGEPVATKRVARLMRSLELRGVSRGRSKRRTTIQDPHAAPATDLVRRDFTAPGPDQKWVADITYVRCDEGWLYLAS